MPACGDQQLLLGALADDELDAANVALVEAHVARCADCREELERLQALSAIVRTNGVRYEAPGGFSTRIAGMPEIAVTRSRNDNSIFRWAAPGLAGALAASLAMVVLVNPGENSIVDQEIVSSHVRSLQPGHLTDVETTNQHIVKPWFNGRIEFSPPVPELARQGFPLAGGRLDSLDGRTVAAIVYRRRLHAVNLYVWPAPNSVERSFAKGGFTVTEWSNSGLRFAAVSDIPGGELEQFETEFRKESDRR